jgi:RNA polymerase sigma-70 factor (ECF subfamily)
MAESDHRLMHRCREGDDAAFEELVRRWESRVAGILGRLTANGVVPPPADVDDMSQEVFLRVLTAARRYRDHYQFSTWLYQIVLNVARDSARRQRRRQKTLYNQRPLPQSPPPVESAARKELQREISTALSTLPPQAREPLVLRHYGDLTFAEVAEVLGLPVSTVKSRVQSALLTLRAELQQRGIDHRELES